MKGMVGLMKITEKWKSVKKRNKVLIIMAVVVIMAGAGIFGGVMFFKGNGMEDQMPVMSQFESGMITASGTTVTDTVTEQLEIDSLETDLYVEEVYVSSGESVTEGTPLLKITDDSLQDAKKELEQKALEAEVAYKEQKVSYEQSLIEARKNADITVAEGKYADSDYEINLAKETTSLTQKQEAATEAQELADEYYAAVNSNYYYTYYEVKELQDGSEDAFSYLMELYEEWNIEDAENAKDLKPGEYVMTWDPEDYTMYQKFDTVVTQLRRELETAKENYEEDTKKAAYSFEAAQAEAQILNAEAQEAAAQIEQKKVQLETQRDVAKAEAELAESNYEAEAKQLAEELDKVTDEYETAKEDYDTFIEMLDDGVLYAQEAGDIMMLNAREGQTLDTNMPYLVYTDSSNVTVTVSVDQAYIAQLSVGDSATVVVSEAGTYQGEITSINPVSQSTSRSSIYYSVELTLSGDLSGVTSNLTATVMFGGENEEIDRQLPEEDKEQQRERKQDGAGEDGKSRGEKQNAPEAGGSEGSFEKPAQEE